LARYVEGLLKIDDVESSRKIIHSIMNKYRNDGGNIIHVVQDAPEGSPIFTPNTPLAQIVEELTPRGNEPVCPTVKLSGKANDDSRLYTKSAQVHSLGPHFKIISADLRKRS
jgi:hypothetical protein